jgi:hypothetical protein
MNDPLLDREWFVARWGHAMSDDMLHDLDRLLWDTRLAQTRVEMRHGAALDTLAPLGDRT